MKAKWFIIKFGKEEHIHKLFYGVQEAGREAEVLSMGEFVEMLETPSEERACIVTSGSIWVNEYTRKQRPNWTGNWHDEKKYTCQRYYSYWGKYLTQQDYAMFTLAEIDRKRDWIFKTFGTEDQIFLRPDSGSKEFTGCVVSLPMVNSWAEDVLSLGGNAKDLLCVVAKPKSLDRELRLVIKNGKVVTGSSYRIAKHLADEPLSEMDGMDRVIEFAETALADNPPPLPPVHVLDIAIEEGGKISILEVGCFCCAGLYQCDRSKIAVAVSEAAEEEFSVTPV